MPTPTIVGAFFARYYWPGTYTTLHSKGRYKRPQWPIVTPYSLFLTHRAPVARRYAASPYPTIRYANPLFNGAENFS